jgi:protein gp37
MNKSAIEWTDLTWNPVSGCDKVSQGCKFCYAEAVSKRWGRPFLGAVKVNTQKLLEPLRIKGSKKVFVNSMSDLFHPDVPFDFIDNVFAVMDCRPKLTFQILTKRPERMLEYFEENRSWRVGQLKGQFDSADYDLNSWPLRNVWLGVSCEDQQTASWRIPFLKRLPAAVKFISAEPLLGPINFFNVTDYGFSLDTDIDWVIAGGESGPKARPMHPDWARSLREQCNRNNVPFFFKQWGQWAPIQFGYLLSDPERWKAVYRDGFQSNVQLVRDNEYGAIMMRSPKNINGHVLDGKVHQGFPTIRKQLTLFPA